jgi:hypothetical protein
VRVALSSFLLPIAVLLALPDAPVRAEPEPVPPARGRLSGEPEGDYTATEATSATKSDVPSACSRAASSTSAARSAARRTSRTCSTRYFGGSYSTAYVLPGQPIAVTATVDRYF